MVMHESTAARSTLNTIGVLASGGLDSSILIGHLLREGRHVQPFYIRTGLVWQAEELPALERFLGAVATQALANVVVLELPLADLYDEHWSLTGRNTPGTDSPDEAVFLPGRNALLIVKAAVWCQLHAVGELALAPLGTSPFDDASEGFLHDALQHWGDQQAVGSPRFSPVPADGHVTGHCGLIAFCRAARSCRFAPTPPATTRRLSPCVCSARTHFATSTSTTASTNARAISG